MELKKIVWDKILNWLSDWFMTGDAFSGKRLSLGARARSSLSVFCWWCLPTCSWSLCLLQVMFACMVPEHVCLGLSQNKPQVWMAEGKDVLGGHFSRQNSQGTLRSSNTFPKFKLSWEETPFSLGIDSLSFWRLTSLESVLFLPLLCLLPNPLPPIPLSATPLLFSSPFFCPSLHFPLSFASPKSEHFWLWRKKCKLIFESWKDGAS